VIKLLIVGRGRPGMDPAVQRSYMKDVHGSSVVRLIAEEPRSAPSRYVQNHVSESYVAAGDERDFVTQVWFDGPEHMRAALTAPRYVQDLQPDEDNFVDQSSVVVLPVQESLLLAPVAGAAAKAFLLLPSDNEVAATALRSDDGIRGLVRNAVVREGSPYTVVYEAWFDNLGAADVAARDWHAVTGADVLVVNEYVLHAGTDLPAPDA
jgi:hypothetical protein